LKGDLGMLILKNIKEVKKQIKLWKKQDLSIGLVPTMGYLHEGHKSLIDRAVKENDKVIVSIFINPTQFGPNEDFNRYPKDLQSDTKLCKNSCVDIIFIPETIEMYPTRPNTYINVIKLTEGLCGAKRPVHFKGVCTVVAKLFNIITPTRSYFGEKDAQQLVVIKRMVSDLNFGIEIIGCPIIRDDDGLAKSSRNSHLSDQEHKAALVISSSLKKAKEALKTGITDIETIKKLINDEIYKQPLAKVDYIEIVDSVTLNPVKKIQASTLVATAVYIGKTRLIDNFTWNK
jgi:pantoate--beta-alanine ligase